MARVILTSPVVIPTSAGQFSFPCQARSCPGLTPAGAAR